MRSNFVRHIHPGQSDELIFNLAAEDQTKNNSILKKTVEIVHKKIKQTKLRRAELNKIITVNEQEKGKYILGKSFRFEISDYKQIPDFMYRELDHALY